MIKNLAIGGSSRILFFLALLMGLVCAALVGVYLSTLQSDGGVSGTGPSVPVVVAATGIPALTTVTTDMVRVENVPSSLALAGAFSDTESVVGKKTQIAIVPGQQLLVTNATDAQLAQEAYGPDAPLSLVIPAGKRAFAIYVSQVASVGGLARAGDNVDLILSGENANTEDPAQAGTACYVMQDIPVLAVGGTVALAGGANDTSSVASVDPNPDANAMTLAVTAQQAAQLAAAQISVNETSVGQQMWVSLRQFGDHEVAGGLPTCALSSGS
jgi:pilus assembly protein CpaB